MGAVVCLVHSKWGWWGAKPFDPRGSEQLIYRCAETPVFRCCCWVRVRITDQFVESSAPPLAFKPVGVVAFLCLVFECMCVRSGVFVFTLLLHGHFEDFERAT